MAVNKNNADPETVMIENAEIVGKTEDMPKVVNTAPEKPSPIPADTGEKKTAKDAPADEPGGCCVYLGPNIHGVIQSGTVYAGSKAAVVKQLATVIEKYPLISRLIATGDTLAADRIKVKTSGTLLNNAFKRLAAGHKTM